MMDDLERRIRQAKPGTSHRFLPLTERAEADLAQIKTGTQIAQIQPIRIRTRLPLYLTTAAAALVVFTLVIVAVLVPRPALAATPPLLPLKSLDLETEEALMQLSSAAMKRLQVPETNHDQTIRIQSWVLSVAEDGAKPSATILPENMTIVRRDDGSRLVSVVAGKAYDKNGGIATEPDGTAPGTELWSEQYAAGEYGYIFAAEPPATENEMKQYLATYGALNATSTAGDYLGVITQLMTEWKLTPVQEGALLQVLASLPDIEIAGATTDRLDRDGIAFRSAQVAGYQQLLVVSPTTGEILSIETIYTGHDRTDIPSPAVIAYYAWERE